MSTLIFDIKKRNFKNIFGINYSPKETIPIKIVETQNNISSIQNKYNDIKRYPKLFQIQRNKKYIDKNILNLKLKSFETIQDKFQNIKYNDKLKVNQKNNKTISRNSIKDQDDSDIFSPQFNSTSRSNKIININYNRYTPKKKLVNRKSVREGGTLITHSIEIINNNPYNVKRFIKNVNKRENEINKLLKKNSEDSSGKFFIKKHINLSPLNLNNRYENKSNHNSYSNKKSSLLSYNDQNSEISKFYNSKNELLFPEINILNNKIKNKRRNVIADSYKELNKKIKLQNSIDSEKNKDKKEYTNINNISNISNISNVSNKNKINNIKTLKRNNEFLIRDKMPELKTIAIESYYNLRKHITKNDDQNNNKDNNNIEDIFFIQNNHRNMNKKKKEKQHIEYKSDDKLKEYYVNKCDVILEYAYKEERNNSYRIYMEDKGKSILNFNNDPKKLLFCLFDGHGGDEVSTYLQKNFAEIMKKYLDKIEKNEEKEINFEQLFKEVDENFKSCKYYEIGSTATIIYITQELIKEKIIMDKKTLYCINVGDTKCILTQTTGSRKLSYDDLVSDQNEYNRIVNEGGYVKNGRVCGKLMISRAFGDWETKQYGVICSPHVTKIDINENCKYVIIASDGVWDVLDDLDVYKLSLTTENAKNLCNDIIQNALDKESTDNISCFAIKLND